MDYNNTNCKKCQSVAFLTVEKSQRLGKNANKKCYYCTFKRCTICHSRNIKREYSHDICFRCKDKLFNDCLFA